MRPIDFAPALAARTAPRAAQTDQEDDADECDCAGGAGGDGEKKLDQHHFLASLPGQATGERTGTL